MFSICLVVFAVSIVSLLIGGDFGWGVSIGMLAPFTAVLYGAMRPRDLDDRQLNAQILGLLGLIFLVAAIVSYKEQSVEYFENIRFGVSTATYFMSWLFPTIVLAIFLAMAFRGVAGITRLLLIYFFLSVICMSFGAPVLDVRLDNGPATTNRARVLSKQITGRGGRSSGHVLQVDPETAGLASYRLDVEWPFFDQVTEGDEICLTDHSGALGMTWRQIALCRS